jgi:hypothetical protein
VRNALRYTKTPITAAEMQNDCVLPFFDEQGIAVSCVLTGRGRRVLTHASLAEQHHWYSSVLRGHYGYFGMPHNWCSMNGLRQEVRRI